MLFLPPFCKFARHCSALLALSACLLGGEVRGAEPTEKAAAPSLPPAVTSKVDFSREIAPLFSARCFSCHGPDAQEGQLRLDARAITFRGGQSGPALLPGKSAESLIVRRLAGLDDAPRMPPDEEPLTAEQIGLVRAWIDQGANWPAGFGADVKELPRHWAYVAPVKASLPAVKNTAWIKQPIDHFVLSKLEAEGIEPAAQATRATLLRRVSLDLIGLPPTVEELNAFLADDSPAAYERAVDRLLASPRYGERWARHWLDLVRYADSNGYQADQIRDLWPYRDWVVQAMNDDMPLDQFTREQIAGDLLPNPSLPQRIATAMHRATPCNVEAGVDPEENRVNQVLDRVNVTSTVWLGTTMECVQCHNHKYDPFTQRDYYGLFAFFNNTPLEVKFNSGVQFELAGPNLELPLTPAQQEQRRVLVDQQQQLQAKLKSLTGLAGKVEPATKVAQQDAGGTEATKALECVPQANEELIAEGTPPEPDVQVANAPLERPAYVSPPPAVDKSQQEAEKKKLEAQLAAMKTELEAIKPVALPVMEELKAPRETHILKRGNFLTPGTQVGPSTPSMLHPFPEDAPRNRLGLARWLVCRENPLVGRVMVNRWWAEMFGAGLVRSPEDFGTQSETPLHGAMLDWLAVELADRGWSMKQIHRTIVLSATYQQSSQVREELQQRDPENKLLASGPRFRLPAETIRDNALAICGLLSTKMTGPPVFPPQPAGIWRHVGRNAPVYQVSAGEDRFRRGLYVIWRRSAPYASFVNFDAPDRASACIKRPRTNTPLQALTLMNDPAYLEMAQAFGKRMQTELPSAKVEERVDFGFRCCVGRPAQPAERAALVQLYQAQLARYQADLPAALKLLGLPEANNSVAKQVTEPATPRAEQAAWFFVASVLLNLDETITKN